MQRSVALSHDDRRFNPFDALFRLAVVVVSVAAVSGPFRRTVYAWERFHTIGYCVGDCWRMSLTPKVDSSSPLSHQASRGGDQIVVSHQADHGAYLVQKSISFGGGIIEHPLWLTAHRELVFADVVAAVTGSPVPQVLGFATALAILVTLNRRYRGGR